MVTTKATTNAPHPTTRKNFVLPYLNPDDLFVGIATKMVVVVTAVKADVVVVIALVVVVMLHSSLKSTTVPGTVQLNLAAHD